MENACPKTKRIAELANEVGLELRAIVPAQELPADVMTRLDQWLQDGRAAGMDYIGAARGVMGDVREWKKWTRSIALFALPYHRDGGEFRDGGRVARYALGRDYHNLLGKRLERLGKRLRREGMVQSFRGCTDAAPVLEREWAILGNVGWRGKNTLVLDPAYGPWVLLGELLMDMELPTFTATPPADANSKQKRWASCGSCTACLDVCPTGALTSAYEIDARLCISYLTIEHRGSIPVELRRKMGDWVFGCDLCSEVCPFGHHANDHADDWGTKDALSSFRLEDLLALTAAEFADAFAGSPIRRAGLSGLQRNACVALGNLKRGGAELELAARSHTDPLVREHAAWALAQ
jgi:epoxyqueuosine reductase